MIKGGRFSPFTHHRGNNKSAEQREKPLMRHKSRAEEQEEGDGPRASCLGGRLGSYGILPVYCTICTTVSTGDAIVSTIFSIVSTKNIFSIVILVLKFS